MTEFYEGDQQYMGILTDEKCPQCGAKLHKNSVGDLFCSMIRCDFIKFQSDPLADTPDSPENSE